LKPPFSFIRTFSLFAFHNPRPESRASNCSGERVPLRYRKIVRVLESTHRSLLFHDDRQSVEMYQTRTPMGKANPDARTLL